MRRGGAGEANPTRCHTGLQERRRNLDSLTRWGREDGGETPTGLKEGIVRTDGFTSGIQLLYEE